MAVVVQGFTSIPPMMSAGLGQERWPDVLFFQVQVHLGIRNVMSGTLDEDLYISLSGKHFLCFI